MAKTKAAPSPAPKSAPAAGPELVFAIDMKNSIDELGALEEELAPILSVWEKKMKRVEVLRKCLRNAVAAYPGESTPTLDGARYRALFGQKKNERYVRVVEAFKILGRALFFKHAKISVTVIEDICTKEDQAALIASERTGSRELTVYRIPATEKAAEEPKAA